HSVLTMKCYCRTRVVAVRNTTGAKNAYLLTDAHYLGPLHPVLDWVAHRALSRIPERGGIYIVRAEVEAPTVVVHAGLTNRRGQMVSSVFRSEEHTSELQSRFDLVCRLLLEKKKRAYIYVQLTLIK